MGAYKNQHQERKDARRRPVRRGDVADWAGVDSVVLRDLIAKAGVRGGAVRFGYTRDGGAYAVGLYGLGEPITEYIRPSEPVESILREFIGWYDDAAEFQPHLQEEKTPPIGPEKA